MNTNIKFDADDLALRDASLYLDLCRAIGLGDLHGEIRLVPATWQQIPESIRDRVMDYLYELNPNAQAHLEEAGEHPDVHAEKAERDAMGKAAISRITQYVNGGVAGFGRLRDNDNNTEKWDEFVAKLPKSVVISPALVDQFISGYRSVLEWDVVPAPAPAPAPQPVVRTLPNGEPELPIDALTTGAYRGASKAQLQDLSRRLGEGRSWFDRKGRVAGDITTDSSRRSGTSQVR